MRLDKLVSEQLNLTRSAARKRLAWGQVAVDGRIEYNGALQVDPSCQEITVQGVRCRPREPLYLMLNKPAGVICATTDPSAPTVLSLLPDELRRAKLAPAGRLDKDTTGFVVLTDDGVFAHQVIAPNKSVYKTYEVQLGDAIPPQTVQKFEKGIPLSDGICRPARLQICEKDPSRAIVQICEGRYHQIKRMFAACDLQVTGLHRSAIGGVSLDPSLSSGEYRPLSPEERKRMVTSHDDTE